MGDQKIDDFLYGPHQQWMKEGLCVTGDVVDVILFASPSDAAEAQIAIERCATCPVRGLCARYALDRPGIEGIWGGRWFRYDDAEWRATS